MSFNAEGRLKTCSRCSLIVRKIPVPTKSISKGGPQTKVLISVKISNILFSPS
ncbi:hypothetical protein EVA_16138 [gut metagenome]|uniref:Uncharacterized protein n=1 Tax=gut metagenome TaxID=749906 RepID=J9C7D0_9ZZZZ